MQLETYIHITRYITVFFFAFFIYQFFASLTNFKELKERSSLWYTLMCLASAFYCIFFTLNTHITDIKTSNAIMNLVWIAAFCSFFAYMKAIEVFFERSIRALTFPKYYIFSLMVFQIFSLISYILFDYSFFFVPQAVVTESFFNQSTGIAISPNLIGSVMGAIGGFCVFYASVVIWFELRKNIGKEYLLRIGLILNVIVMLNDTFISLEVFGHLIPLYYLANAFEAVRFNIFYRQRSFQKLFSLENEIVRLSRLAQFGVAAASIAHDIKNHIFLIKVKIERLIRDKSKDIEQDYNTIAKHNEKILEITDIYMNTFKNNIVAKKDLYEIDEIIKDVVEVVDERFSQTNVELKLEIKHFNVNCNKTELVVCLLNIVKNALEAVQGRDNAWVTIKTCPTTNSVSVIDSGQGIAPEDRDKIFEFGFTQKKNGKGHGIGLAITRELLMRSGFKLEIPPGTENTTFDIRF